MENHSFEWFFLPKIMVITYLRAALRYKVNYTAIQSILNGIKKSQAFTADPTAPEATLNSVQ